MAIDTLAKRLSVINLAAPIPVLPLPAPDGTDTITWEDRSHLIGLYIGISPILADVHPITVQGIIPFFQVSGVIPYYVVSGVV